MSKSIPKGVLRKPSARIRSKRKQSMGLPPEFPLFPHHSGRWAKKVRKKLHYFGKIADDPKGEAAVRLWLENRDRLYAGVGPATVSGGVKLKDICNKFLTSKEKRRDANRITRRTFDCCKQVTDRLIKEFGGETLVESLRPDDFDEWYVKLSKTMGLVSLSNAIQQTKSVFKHAKLAKPVEFGDLFVAPDKSELKRERNEKPKKLFSAEDLKKLLDVADVHLKAMILLGVNCGFGNADCGTLKFKCMDLDAGWIDYPRPKTGMDRRSPLWPETVQALRDSIRERPEPKDIPADPKLKRPAYEKEATSKLVFVTRCGAPWAKGTTENPVTQEFKKLLLKVGIYQHGVGFYALRHTFRTIANKSRDTDAIRAIMGHTNGHVESGYIQELPPDERLRAVVDLVHDWLWPKEKVQPKATRKPKKKAEPEAAPLRIVG